MGVLGRSLSVAPIEVGRLVLDGGDAALARSVLEHAWARLSAEAREKLERLEGDLEIPSANAFATSGTAEDAVLELSARVAEQIEAWIDEVLVREEFGRERKDRTRWSPELLAAVVETVASKPPAAIAELGRVVSETLERRARAGETSLNKSLVQSAEKVLAKGRAPVLDVLEAKSLEMQGLSPGSSLDAIAHFHATGSRHFAGHEWGFQFGSPERHIYSLEAGVPPSPQGFLGKGIYFGTTPTPSWALKHLPVYGWGIGGNPSRLPINLDKHRQHVVYSMFGSVPEANERQAGVDYQRIKWNPMVAQAGIIKVSSHLKLV